MRFINAIVGFVNYVGEVVPVIVSFSLLVLVGLVAAWVHRRRVLLWLADAVHWFLWNFTPPEFAHNAAIKALSVYDRWLARRSWK
jgi:hypothetical protein